MLQKCAQKNPPKSAHQNFSPFDPTEVARPESLDPGNPMEILCRLCRLRNYIPPGDGYISHLGKRKLIFKMPCLGDMLVSWRVYPPASWTFRPWKLYRSPKGKKVVFLPTIVFSGANSLLNFRGCTTWKNSEFEPKKMEVFLLPGISAGDLILGAVTPLKINILHNHGGLFQMIFLFKWVILRFKKPLIFSGVYRVENRWRLPIPCIGFSSPLTKSTFESSDRHPLSLRCTWWFQVTSKIWSKNSKCLIYQTTSPREV